MTRISLALAALLALGLPAAAQETAGGAEPPVENPALETEADGEREAAAWAVAHHMKGDLLAPGQTATFMLLAWHGAAANLCHDLVIDHRTFGEAWATLEHADMASLSDEEHEYFRHHLAVNFGVAVGIMLAEHAGTPEETQAFCDSAHDHAADPSHPSFFAPLMAEAE